MRLREIQQRLDRVDFDAQSPSYGSVGGGEWPIGNLNAFKNLLDGIDDIPGFIDLAWSLRQSAIYATGQDQVSLSGSVLQPIREMADRVKFGGAALKALLPAIIGGELEEDSISIKLPEPNDLKDLTSDLEKIEKSITQVVVNPEINGQVTIRAWEKGSYWIDIFLGTAAAVSLVGGLAWSAAVVFKKIQEGRIFAEYVRGLKAKTGMLEGFEEAQQAFVDQLVDLEARGVETQCFPKHENERIERLKNTIRTFAELMDRGAEIHPALNAPEVVANAFPNMASLADVVSKVKLLKDEEAPTDLPTNVGA